MLISFEKVDFKYEKTLVLSNVNFEINKGDYVTFIGPNGGGKTTIIKLILGLIKPFNGKINLKVEKKRIGYIPQKAVNFDLNFPANVYEIVSMGRIASKGFFKMLDEKDYEKIEEALKFVEMWEHKEEKIGELSGGQQQRVFIAKALCSEPEILILDEPTTGIDKKSRNNFYEILRKLNKKGITLILVSHDISTVINDVNKVFCINQKVNVHDDISELERKENKFLCAYPQNVKFIGHEHNNRGKKND
jgi:zinc transport system ATP-binding protein